MHDPRVAHPFCARTASVCTEIAALAEMQWWGDTPHCTTETKSDRAPPPPRARALPRGARAGSVF
eukprot:3604567-Prymnesium_polylepis.1